MSATIKELIQSEIADFCAGLGNPVEPVKPKQLQSHLMSRILPLLDGVEKAEAELSALAAQKPVAYRWEGEDTGRICYDGVKPLRVASQELFTRAAPAGVVAPDDNLTLIARLVRALKKHQPDSDLVLKSLDYLQRNGYGSPMRGAPVASHGKGGSE